MADFLNEQGGYEFAWVDNGLTGTRNKKTTKSKSLNLWKYHSLNQTPKPLSSP